jgi:two-component system response regulator YesN
MLVDDEPLILDGLKNIIPWESLGFQVVETARDGLEALQKSREVQFDILITDIKMPELTGLQLIRQLKEEKRSQFYTIVLSGFEEFELVKEGLKLGIENYLLKPINEDELISSLKHVKEKINRTTLEEESILVLRDHSIWRWCTGKMGFEEFKQRMSFYPDLQVISPFWIGLLKLEWDEQNEKDFQSLQRTFERETNAISVLTPTGDILLLWLNCSDDTWDNELEKFHLRLKLMKKPGEYVFVNSKKIDDLNNFQGVFRELEMASELKMLLSEREQNIAEQLYSKSEQPQKFSSNYLSNDILEQLANQDYGSFKKSMRKILAQFELEKPPLLMKSVLLEFFFYVKNKFFLHIDYELYVKTIQQILYIETLDEGLEIVDKCIELFDKDFLQQVEEFSPIIQSVLNHIHQNLSEEMSLKTLGSSFHINPIYLGQLFQKEVNCSFTKYLNKLRIEKAKKLLLNSYEKAGAIGKKVGYTDATYFYKQFKKLEGLTPSEWKKAQHQKN